MLQHVREVEHDLQQLDQAIAECTELIYEGKFPAPNGIQTKTRLDKLLAALSEQSRRHSRQEKRPQQRLIRHLDQLL